MKSLYGGGAVLSIPPRRIGRPGRARHASGSQMGPYVAEL
jgi:hypothetical protein